MRLSRQLPLNALRAFEATARLLSFTRAGEELGLTQAAVSYQIRQLEETIGKPLFLRRPRRIELTSTGEKLMPQVAEAFGMLRHALTSIARDEENTIVLTATPTFTAQWLTRNLVSFHAEHPEIAVQLFSTDRMCEFGRDPIDIAVRVGAGRWPGLAVHKLFDTLFTPMLSPILLNGRPELEKPADLLHFPILDPADPWWLQWFREAGIDKPDLSGRPQHQFGTQVLEANAAIAGQGVAILTPGFYRSEIQAGLLIQPFEQVSCNDSATWLVYPEEQAETRKIRVFREWLLREMEKSFGAPSDQPRGSAGGR